MQRPRWLGNCTREGHEGRRHRGGRHDEHGYNCERTQLSNTCGARAGGGLERRADGQLRGWVSALFVAHDLGHSLTDAYSHLNIGAGRIVWQDIVRIDQSIKKREFHKSANILKSCKHAKEGNGRLHLLGLVCYLPSQLAHRL